MEKALILSKTAFTLHTMTKTLIKLWAPARVCGLDLEHCKRGWSPFNRIHWWCGHHSGPDRGLQLWRLPERLPEVCTLGPGRPSAQASGLRDHYCSSITRCSCQKKQGVSADKLQVKVVKSPTPSWTCQIQATERIEQALGLEPLRTQQSGEEEEMHTRKSARTKATGCLDQMDAY